jgi:hypothetical protein
MALYIRKQYKLSSASLLIQSPTIKIVLEK